MMIDILDRRVERTLALLYSPEGRRIYRRNKYEFGLGRMDNICGIIQKACGRVLGEALLEAYDRVEEELAARKAERASA